MVPGFGVSAECQRIGTSGNDSYLRACMKLQIVEKIRFSLHEFGVCVECQSIGTSGKN